MKRQRKSEFLARAVDMLLPGIYCNSAVRERLAQLHCSTRVYPPAENEVLDIPPELSPVCKMLAGEWCRLYDEWANSKPRYEFCDGFLLCFFLRVCFAQISVVLRGQVDSRWTLQSSMARALRRGQDRESIRRKAEDFLVRVQKVASLQVDYPNGFPPEHEQAILQHYGFPTELIDCTYSYDVALFFAEGARDFPDPFYKMPHSGAIYCLPVHKIMEIATLTTLPSSVMRPSLQRGVFISGLDEQRFKEIEKDHKYIFLHGPTPVWSGLTDIRFPGPVGLGSYLMPSVDPLDMIASAIRKEAY
jgi:hypothetical protein